MQRCRIIALPLMLAAATVAGAQSRPAAGQATLLQMEIKVLPAGRTAAARTFAADTRRFRQCGDALRLASRYKAEKRFTGQVTVRDRVALRSLPPALQAELRSRPAGHASRVYTGPGTLRVLVACTAPVDRTTIDRTI